MTGLFLSVSFSSFSSIFSRCNGSHLQEYFISTTPKANWTCQRRRNRRSCHLVTPMVCEMLDLLPFPKTWERDKYSSRPPLGLKRFCGRRERRSERYECKSKAKVSLLAEVQLQSSRAKWKWAAACGVVYSANEHAATSNGARWLDPTHTSYLYCGVSIRMHSPPLLLQHVIIK